MYLDHWAIREISSNKIYSQKFVADLKRHHGDLCLSYLTFLECSRNDDDQIGQIEDLIETALPNVITLALEPLEVIEKSRAALVPGLPWIDEPYANVFRGGKSLNPISIRGQVKNVKEPSLGEEHKKLQFAIMQEVASFRRRILENSSNFEISWANCDSPCKPVLEAILLELGADKLMSFGENDADDLLQVAVPSVFCDFLLIDGKWRDLIANKIQRRLELKSQFKIQLAKPYCKKGNGVEEFLADLNVWSGR